MAIITTNEVIVRRGANPLLSGLTDLLDVSLPTFLPTNIARPTLKSFASSYLIKAKEPWTFKKKPAKYILHFITLNISQFKSRTKEILREFFFFFLFQAQAGNTMESLLTMAKACKISILALQNQDHFSNCSKTFYLILLTKSKIHSRNSDACLVIISTLNTSCHRLLS